MGGLSSLSLSRTNTESHTAPDEKEPRGRSMDKVSRVKSASQAPPDDDDTSRSRSCARSSPSADTAPVGPEDDSRSDHTLADASVPSPRFRPSYFPSSDSGTAVAARAFCYLPPFVIMGQSLCFRSPIISPLMAVVCIREVRAIRHELSCH